MKNKNNFTKIAIALTVSFSLTAGLLTFKHVSHTKVEAAQHINNYADYTYTGSYYNSIDFNSTGGMNGALRQSLATLIKPAGFYTYGGSGETHLSTQLQYADEDPINDNNMVLFYSRDSITKTAATVNSVVQWNREHVWCKNLSNTNWCKDSGAEDEAGTDILHLRPTYSSINSARSDIPYGDINKSNPKYFDTSTKKVTNDSSKMLYAYSNGTYFEPLDALKGDVARIIMYVWTTYTGWVGKKTYQPLNILNIIQSYDTLLKWHTQDKPDALEGNRNNYAQSSKQKNRNPFVDHPELAWKIFGDNASSNIKNACMAAYPANGGDVIEPTGISLNKINATMTVGRTLQLSATLQPNGATGSISWSTSNNSVASVSSAGLVTAKGMGNATITATVGGYSATCSITVNEAVDNYGSLQNPLSVDDAIEVINRGGGNETSQPLYIKGIVASNEAYEAGSYNNYRSIWLQSDDGNTSQAFQIYKATAGSAIYNTYSSENSLQGLEVIAYGYGLKYNNTTYELSTSNNVPNKPQLMSVKAPDATAISLDKEEAEIEISGTVTLNATLTPSNSESPITWESSDESVATVNNGVVTGVKAGTAIITAKVTEEITAECFIVVTSDSEETYTKLASYDFSSGNSSSTSEYDASGLLSRFSSSASNAIGLSDIVNGVSATSKTYAGYTNYYNYGLKLGTSSAVGTFTLSLSERVDRVAVNVAGWGTTDTLSIGDAEIQTPGVAYNSNNSIKTLTFDITSSSSVSFTFTKRGFIQSIDFYTVYSTTPESPADFLDNVTNIAKLNGEETIVSDSQSDSISFADLGLENGVQYLEPFASENSLFSITFAGGGNDGKYYTTGTGIRTYGGGTITISSAEPITNITLTWDGSYKPDSDNVANCGTYTVSSGIWTGNSDSVTFTRPSGSGHWRLKSVTATCGEKIVTVDKVNMDFGVSIAQSDWNAIASKWTISDYGVMFVKESTLTNTYHAPSVEEAFNNDETLGIVHKGSGETPFLDGNNYVFTAKINMTKVSNYGVTYCAAPFIVINDVYYFLSEMRYSVNSLAEYHFDNGGSDLSDEALLYLATL